MIESVEMQGIVQRSHDVTQIKQHEDNKPMNEHNVMVLNQQKEAVNKHEQIVKQDNANNNQKKYDAKEKGNGTYYKQKKEREKKEKEDGVVIKKDKSFFDIKI